MIDLLFTAIELGLLLSLVVFGVFFTFRVLNFPDLSVDGSFVTGAAASGIAIIAGVPGLLALLIGFIAGFLAGSITAFLHIKLGIGKILSGILSLSMLYTINLRLMDGPNLSLLNQEGIITWFKFPLNHFVTILFLLVIVTLIKLLIDWFLSSEIGLFIRATGDNESTVKSFGVNTNLMKFIALGLSNGLAGMSGALLSQYQGFVDINMGIGIIILGLAAFMIGEALITKQNIPYITAAIIFGTILYEFIINISLRLGLAGTDLKLVTAVIVIIALVVGSKKHIFYGRLLSGNKKLI